MDRRAHWESVYAAKPVTGVSWYEAEPQVSLDLILQASPERGGVVDVGGGASLLVDRLLAAGFREVAVLDVSPTALHHARTRLGPLAERVRWIEADVTTSHDIGQFDVWHDRAVFHFLTSPDDRRRYVDLALRTIPVGGHAVVGTFAIGGPPKCSGLEVCRYDAASLAGEFGPRFELVRDLTHVHATPAGKTQEFFFAMFRRTD